MFLQLAWIGLPCNRDNDATFLHYTIRSRQSITAYGVENDIDILNYILKLRGGVIDRLIYSKLLKQVLVRGRCRSNNFGAARFGDLHSERPDPAGTAVNQNRLSGAQSSRLHQRLPGCRCREWDGRGLFKIDRPGLERRMILVRDRKLSITALFFKTEIGVDGVASLKLRDVVSSLFYYARHIHAGDERKPSAPSFANENVNRIHP